MPARLRKVWISDAATSPASRNVVAEAQRQRVVERGEQRHRECREESDAALRRQDVDAAVPQRHRVAIRRRVPEQALPIGLAPGAGDCGRSGGGRRRAHRQDLHQRAGRGLMAARLRTPIVDQGIATVRSSACACSAPARAPPASRWPATDGNTAWTSSGSAIGRPGQHRPGARRREQQQAGARREPPTRTGVCAGAHIAARRGEQRLHVIEQRRRHMHGRGFALPFEKRRRIRERRKRRDLRAPVAAGQELALRRGVRIADFDCHQETIELRFGQRVGADLLDRVLRGDHEERIGQPARFAVLRDLPLFHRLHQRALRLRRRAVDFVGEHDRVEDRAGMKAERARFGVEDRHAEHVGGKEVARELHARVLEAERGRERLGERRLAHAGDVLDQQMAAGEQAREGELQRLALADDDAVELRQHRGQALGDRIIGLAEGADGHGPFSVS